MSHFYTLVLVPESVTEPGEEVQRLLAPYDENLQVEPYRDDREPDIESMIEFYSTDRYKKVLSRRSEYDRDVLLKIEENLKEWGPPRLEDRESLVKWYEHYSGEELLFDEDGTPYTRTQYNPLSQWDWWVVGGRWTGVLDGYDPSTDPENWEVCFICGGTGMRMDRLGLSARAEDPSYTCNGCQGKGKSLAFSFKHYPGDMQPVELLLKAAEEFVPPSTEEIEQQAEVHAKNPILAPPPKVSPDFVPYALVTPEGEWIEKGKMGWWGMSFDEVGEDEWAETVMTVLRRYRDCLAVACDLHI